MTTTVTKSIGTGGTRDYSSVSAWEAAAPADLTSVDQIWKGECYNDGELAGVTVAGITTDSTRYVELTAAAGQSFVDNANKLTNALKYNVSNGVGMTATSTVISNQIVNLKLRRLQVKVGTNFASEVAYTSQNMLDAEQCIFENGSTAGSGTTVNCSSFAGDISARVVNCLIVNRRNGIGLALRNLASGSVVSSTTIVATSDLAGSTGISFSAGTNTNVKIIDNAIFGFSTAAVTSGTYATGSDYNATDLSSTGVGGAHDQVSLTYSSQFQNVTNASGDWRAVDTGSLDTAGTPDSANTGDVDIVGSSRSGSTPTIGAWEVAAGGGGGGTAVPVFRRHYQTMQVR